MDRKKRIPPKKDDTAKKPAAHKTKSVEFSLEKAAFLQQENFINDPARLKALFCTRRAAKSYTGGLYLVSEALKNPGSNLLYIALTRETAKGIVWKDILKELNQKFDLNMVFNGSTLTATLPNGSEILVTGADADEDEMNKLLGKKYRLVIIDEASMFSVNLRRMVYGILRPATADQQGTICMLGTASNITKGLFYDITTFKESGWSLHKWTAFDNPHVAKQWREDLDEIDRMRPSFKKTALFRQWYLNEWVIDENALIYKFLRQRNDLTTGLPQFDVPYRFVLSISLGHSPDPSALIVAAYNEQSPFLFIVKSIKDESLDAYGIVKKSRELEKDYNFEVKVIHGLSKATAEEMNIRYGIQVVLSDMGEKDKDDWINLFNSELTQQRVFFLNNSEELKREMEVLVWEVDGNGDVKKPRKEHKGIPNQLSNALLSLWHYTHSYLYMSPMVENKQEDWERRHIDGLIEQCKRDQNPHLFDAEFLPPDELFDFDKDDVI